MYAAASLFLRHLLRRHCFEEHALLICMDIGILLKVDHSTLLAPPYVYDAEHISRLMRSFASCLLLPPLTFLDNRNAEISHTHQLRQGVAFVPLPFWLNALKTTRSFSSFERRVLYFFPYLRHMPGSAAAC